jgi:F-type H+-transporting ATPase subunit gamma
MASLRQIRRRIKSVKSTRQITKAMQMVAAAKLKKAEFRLLSARPYARKMDEMMARLMQAHTGELNNPLLETQEVQKELLVIISSDKGLCGSYNMNIIRKAEEYLAGKDKSKICLGLIGRKAVDHFKRQPYPVLFTNTEFSGNVDYARILALAQQLTRYFVERKMNEINLLYTNYLSTMKYQPVLVPYLPFRYEQAPSPAITSKKAHLDYIFEPDTETIFNEFLPRYLTTKVYISLAESFTSEHSARMIAMKNATESAEEMIASLTLLANKLRQASITREITEIVGGAEALKG